MAVTRLSNGRLPKILKLVSKRSPLGAFNKPTNYTSTQPVPSGVSVLWSHMVLPKGFLPVAYSGPSQLKMLN